MGTATAGFSSTVEISTDDISYDVIGGAYDVSFDTSRNALDATDFSDTDMARILGLGDVSVSVSVNYDDSDTGQSALDTAHDGGSDIYFRVLLDGTNGIKAKCLVESVSYSSGVDGKIEAEYSLVLNDGTGWSRV